MALFILFLGSFCLGTAEFMATGLLPQVASVEIRGRCTVKRELPEDLAEAATTVQEGVPATDAVQKLGVLGRARQIQVQEAPAADAAVGEDSPSLVPLRKGAFG